jgi:hypothetical protein
MAKPLFLREKTPAGRMLSVRAGPLFLDFMQKKKELTLLQLGRGRAWFLCRLDEANEDPPIFLFDSACNIRWAKGNLYAGVTTKPVDFDRYWRRKGWTIDRKPGGLTEIGSGSAPKKGHVSRGNLEIL